MDIDNLKELLKLIEKSNFSKVEINIKGDFLKLEKMADNKELSVDKVASFERKKCFSNGKEFYAEDGDNIEDIKAPMVGVFHNSINAEEEPFVNVGDNIRKGDVVGIIEAMKLMNEIESQYDGEVIEICTENNEVVGYGDVLVKIKVK